MVFGVILAGGIGSRMGNVEKPKQYLKVGDKPIIIHTIEKFIVHDAFAKLIVLCPKPWVENTKKLVDKYLGEMASQVVVLEGGSSRNETIMNSIRYIESEYGKVEKLFTVGCQSCLLCMGRTEIHTDHAFFYRF